MTNELNITQIGQTNWPRYVLKKGADRFWTGSAWSEQCRQAVLFSCDSDAEQELEVLQKYSAPREFVVPVKILMDARADWSAEIVAQYLQQHVRISDGCESENPNDTICDLEIEWDLIDEVE